MWHTSLLKLHHRYEEKKIELSMQLSEVKEPHRIRSDSRFGHNFRFWFGIRIRLSTDFGIGFENRVSNFMIRIRDSRFGFSIFIFELGIRDSVIQMLDSDSGLEIWFVLILIPGPGFAESQQICNSQIHRDLRFVDLWILKACFLTKTKVKTIGSLGVWVRTLPPVDKN